MITYKKIYQMDAWISIVPYSINAVRLECSSSFVVAHIESIINFIFYNFLASELIKCNFHFLSVIAFFLPGISFATGRRSLEKLHKLPYCGNILAANAGNHFIFTGLFYVKVKCFLLAKVFITELIYCFDRTKRNRS